MKVKTIIFAIACFIFCFLCVVFFAANEAEIAGLFLIAGAVSAILLEKTLDN